MQRRLRDLKHYDVIIAVKIASKSKMIVTPGLPGQDSVTDSTKTCFLWVQTVMLAQESQTVAYVLAFSYQLANTTIHQPRVPAK